MDTFNGSQVGALERPRKIQQLSVDVGHDVPHIHRFRGIVAQPRDDVLQVALEIHGMHRCAVRSGVSHDARRRRPGRRGGRRGGTWRVAQVAPTAGVKEQVLSQELVGADAEDLPGGG
jgi:hypothetical protein